MSRCPYIYRRQVDVSPSDSDAHEEGSQVDVEEEAEYEEEAESEEESEEEAESEEESEEEAEAEAEEEAEDEDEEGIGPDGTPISFVGAHASQVGFLNGRVKFPMLTPDEKLIKWDDDVPSEARRAIFQWLNQKIPQEAVLRKDYNLYLAFAAYFRPTLAFCEDQWYMYIGPHWVPDGKSSTRGIGLVQGIFYKKLVAHVLKYYGGKVGRISRRYLTELPPSINYHFQLFDNEKITKFVSNIGKYFAREK
jgi:hypothetical protein